MLGVRRIQKIIWWRLGVVLFRRNVAEFNSTHCFLNLRCGIHQIPPISVVSKILDVISQRIDGFRAVRA